MEQRLKANASGTLVLVSGPPGPADSAPTVTVTDADGNAVKSGAAVLSTLSTTVAAPGAVAGAKALPVASETGALPEEQAWVGAVASDKLEQVTIRSADTGSLALADPLAEAHPATEPVKGARMTFALDAVDIPSAARNYLAVWAYQVNGVAIERTQVFHVVDHVFALTLTPAEVRERVPLALLRSSGRSEQALIQLAEGDVIRLLKAATFNPDYVYDAEQLDILATYRIFCISLEREAALNPAKLPVLEAYQEMMMQEWLRLMEAKLTWYDVNADEQFTDDENQARRLTLKGSAYVDFTR